MTHTNIKAGTICSTTQTCANEVNDKNSMLLFFFSVCGLAVEGNQTLYQWVLPVCVNSRGLVIFKEFGFYSSCWSQLCCYILLPIFSTPKLTFFCPISFNCSLPHPMSLSQLNFLLCWCQPQSWASYKKQFSYFSYLTRLSL